ncbi:hypothetical protein [uncultured Methanospirillum sp.]|uniref:hypothetical protein n=1 Tax=uncultured Methanospirillum sp. TaxID=262503 RepID=UPI0029C781CD|nr:hypothetical protein [uncultured Methanospirillum sp.]
MQQKYDRIAYSLAQRLLRTDGYIVEKTTGHISLFNLIAWKGTNEIRFIRIRRSRKPGVDQFNKEIVNLADLVKIRSIPGVVEFWLLSTHQWYRYLILEGGAVPLEIGEIK